MMNQNNEVIGNLMLEMTRMKEKMASMQEEINELKRENEELRANYELIDQINIRLMDKIFPEWRTPKKEIPKLRLVG
ncbi:TPA: hypothetical protein ACISXB_004086 [Salmonella enterica subsp. enterica serovar Javiana]